MTGVVLAPTTGATLIDTTEDAYVTETITATTADGPVTWEWSIDPPDANDNFIVVEGATTLDVSYADANNLWPATITFLDNERDIESVEYFNNIPEDTRQIIEMVVPTENIKTWTLTATATNSAMASATGTYTIKIEANYNLNRDRLVAQIAEDNG